MQTSDFLGTSAVFAALVAILGWWLRSRLEASIKHEYDRVLLSLESQLRRNDTLYSERLSAFKELSSELVMLRRYCDARSAELGDASEFEPRTDALTNEENISLLTHAERLRRTIDKYELFLSPATRQQFDGLFNQMSIGFNLEVWLTESATPQELNAASLYDLVSYEVSATQGTLYSDLGFKPEGAAANKSFEPDPLRRSA